VFEWGMKVISEKEEKEEVKKEANGTNGVSNGNGARKEFVAKAVEEALINL
jgi:hypothetical protein